MNKRNPPERTCVGCRSVKPKRDLIRVVRDPNGIVQVDRTGRSAGRGAYVCPDAACLERALKERRLERALSSQVGEEVRERLRAELTQR